MRVATADQIPVSAVDRFAKQSMVVTVEKRDPFPLEFEPSKSLVIGLASLGDCLAQGLWIVGIAKYEMRRPRGEKADDGWRTDVPAVKDEIDLKTGQTLDRQPRSGEMPVCVAENADAHEAVASCRRGNASGNGVCRTKPSGNRQGVRSFLRRSAD